MIFLLLRFGLWYSCRTKDLDVMEIDFDSDAVATCGGAS